MNQLLAGIVRNSVLDDLKNSDYKHCRWKFPLADFKSYCYFLADLCPISCWESESTFVDYISERSEFHRCYLGLSNQEEKA